MELTVQQRRPSLTSRRCCLAVLIASASAFTGIASVSAAEPEVPPMLRIPTAQADVNVQTPPALNSTLKIRVARRPWLLEKLTKPSTQPSIKMRPPRPPAAIPDPPSIGLTIPENGNEWVTRGRVKSQVPNYADLKLKSAGKEKVSDDASFVDDLAPQTEMQNVLPEPAASAEPSSERPSSDSSALDATAPEPTVVNERVTESIGAETNTLESTTTKKTKLEFKAKDFRTNQSNIGEKSTATLKGAAVIVGENGKQPASSATTDISQSAAESKRPAPPQQGTATGEISDSTSEGRQSEPKMVGAAQPAEETEIPDSNRDTVLLGQNDKTEGEAENSNVDQGKASAAETEVTKPTSDEEPSEVDVVKVRKLRLQADGTVSDKSGLAKSETASLKAEEDAKRVPTSQFVSSDNPSATKIDYTGRPAEPLQMTRSVSRMQNAIKQGLLYHYARPEAANERSNWGMLHSIMVFGADTKIRVNKRKHSAIAWIAGNNACRGQRLLTVQDDAIVARSGVGLQGHQAQLLAVFSLCDVPLDYPVYASNQKFSTREMVESEMLACRTGEELTFSLIGLSHYLDTDTIWLNADGETWSFERLIKEELSQPIVGAACGGTHRLMGFAHALRNRRAAGKPITGQWKRAEIFMKDFEKYAYRLQNRDGSMSTDWFEGREDNGDMDRKIQTTGHMVEWLLTITPDSKLQEPALVNAVRFLANTIYKERGHDWKIGPKGHALRSLAMYYERVYGGDTAWQSNSMAKSGSQSRR